LTRFEWLTSILAHARKVGRFLYHLTTTREARVVFEDKSAAEVSAKMVSADPGLATEFLAHYAPKPSVEIALDAQTPNDPQTSSAPRHIEAKQPDDADGLLDLSPSKDSSENSEPDF